MVFAHWDKRYAITYNVTRFTQLFRAYNTWERQEILDFLAFSRDIETEHWTKTGYFQQNY